MLALLLRFVGLFALALWVGGGVAITFLVAPVAFERLPTRAKAGELVGGVLRRFDRLVLLCVVLAGASVAHRCVTATSPAAMLQAALVALMAGLALLSQTAITPAIARLRAAMGDVDAVPKEDPRRREFGKLHGVSILLLLAQLLLGAFAMALMLL